MQKIKNLFRSSESRNGSYSVGITALVIAIIVIVNLIAGQIPEKYKNLDVSSTKIYEISKTSKKLLKNMDHKVKFTVLANKEEADERIVTFLSKYSALSSKISVEWIDPVLHPSALTENDASENSIVVSCQETGKSFYIPHRVIDQVINIQIKSCLCLTAQTSDIPALQDKFLSGHSCKAHIRRMNDLPEILALHIGLEIQLHTST